MFYFYEYHPLSFKILFSNKQLLLRVDNLALLSLFYRYITTAIVLVLCFYFIQVQVHDGGNGYSSKIVLLL